MADRTAPGRSRRRRPLPMLAVAAALAVWAGWPAVPAQLHAQEPDLVVVARAFDAAWNAHDLDAMLAVFAPDAVVRERRGDVPAAVWDTRDPRVVRDYLDDSNDGAAYDTHGLTWVTGRPRIAAWAAARFAQRHRFAAGPYRTAGDTVGWPYREFIDPFQLLPGVGPTEGEAEAVVRGGRIAVFTLVQSPASVRRRRGALEAIASQAVATRRAAPPGAEPSGPARGPRRATEPTDATWSLALGGLAVLSAVTAALRRRAPHR